ncbi:unnamed protein product [Protopolystoma xenopodis]|uniref:Uncharacterized protein n=1 Tax=Protopolystoma xenopodis TaxID=117903 RepID=A0A448WBZ5_9PLAT|nr:unnamed protein product [Protopolystoma xenopodis]
MAHFLNTRAWKSIYLKIINFLPPPIRHLICLTFTLHPLGSPLSDLFFTWITGFSLDLIAAMSYEACFATATAFFSQPVSCVPHISYLYIETHPCLFVRPFRNNKIVMGALSIDHRRH